MIEVEQCYSNEKFVFVKKSKLSMSPMRPRQRTASIGTYNFPGTPIQQSAIAYRRTQEAMETPTDIKLEQDRKRRRENTPKEEKHDSATEELKSIIRKMIRTAIDLQKLVDANTNTKIEIKRMVKPPTSTENGRE